VIEVRGRAWREMVQFGKRSSLALKSGGSVEERGYVQQPAIACAQGLDVLIQSLENDAPTGRLRASLAVLKTVGLTGLITPGGLVEIEDLELELAEQNKMRETRDYLPSFVEVAKG
jgi:hypothetical protein